MRRTRSLLGHLAVLSLLAPLPGATWMPDPLGYLAPLAAPDDVIQYRMPAAPPPWDPLNYHRPEVRTVPNHALEVTGRTAHPGVLELTPRLRGVGPPGYL